MSIRGLAVAMESFLRGDQRLALLSVGDTSGIPDLASVMMWVGCTEDEAQRLVEGLIEGGYLRMVGAFVYAPDIYEGRAPAERTDRRHATAEMRKAIFERDGHVCSYCGGTAGPFHIDHVIPHSRGGKTSMENLVVACMSCNVRKKDRTPEEMGWVQ